MLLDHTCCSSPGGGSDVAAQREDIGTAVATATTEVNTATNYPAASDSFTLAVRPRTRCGSRSDLSSVALAKLVGAAGQSTRSGCGQPEDRKPVELGRQTPYRAAGVRPPDL